MERQLTIEEVRHFLGTASKQFEKGGIFLERVRFKRNEQGVCTGIVLDYEDRNEKQEDKK